MACGPTQIFLLILLNQRCPEFRRLELTVPTTPRPTWRPCPKGIGQISLIFLSTKLRACPKQGLELLLRTLIHSHPPSPCQHPLHTDVWGARLDVYTSRKDGEPGIVMYIRKGHESRS